MELKAKIDVARKQGIKPFLRFLNEAPAMTMQEVEPYLQAASAIANAFNEKIVIHYIDLTPKRPNR